MDITLNTTDSGDGASTAPMVPSPENLTTAGHATAGSISPVIPGGTEASLEVRPLPPLVISQDGKPRPPLVITIATNEQDARPVPNVSQPGAAPEVSPYNYAANTPSFSPSLSLGQEGQLGLEPKLAPAPGPEPWSQLGQVAQLEPGQEAQLEPELGSELGSEPKLAPATGSRPEPAPKKAESRKHSTVETTRSKRSRKSSKDDAKRLFLMAFRDVLIALALLTILLQFFSPTVVREHSMENTLNENEILYIAKKAYWFGPPQYGDIVVFHTNMLDQRGSEKSLVKRIIGLPGDHISISGGMVIRNNEILDEPYLKDDASSGVMNELVVPEDSYFVLGDNRKVSNDSRNPDIGCINKEQLRGKVIFRFFPLNEFKMF